jgi:protein-S-isoprenylcysteine O-methyltransferase Ste14
MLSARFSNEIRTEGERMFVAARAVVYATAFTALLLVYLPGRVLVWAGVRPPAVMGAPPVMGMVLSAAGAAIALWCIGMFVRVGKGTPAPFDPPRRLVERGPYRFLRNPMYVGGVVLLGGAALFYWSWTLLTYTAVFLLVAHLFVVLYEEPTLERSFGEEYLEYRRRVGRWWPRL